MSNEPKKYPANTPVTLEMLAEILRKVSVKCKSPTAGWICEMVEEHIEPPKPEPKEGELWLCLTTFGRRGAAWRFSGGWTFWSDGEGKFGSVLTPLKRLIPQEDKA